jgi:hypothetical protein
MKINVLQPRSLEVIVNPKRDLINEIPTVCYNSVAPPYSSTSTNEISLNLIRRLLAIQQC